MKGRGFRSMKRQGGWLGWAALATSVVGTVLGFSGSKKAEKSAKQQAELEKQQEEAVTKEKLRQLGIEERVTYGETLAQYAGSGVLATTQGLDRAPLAMVGSPRTILDEQAREFAKQKEITAEVGATKVQQALAGGKATADYYRYSGYANVAKGMGDIFQIIKTYELGKKP